MSDKSPDLLLRREDRRFDPVRYLSYALMFAFSYYIFYQFCLRPSSDISIHATWAAECDFRDFDSFFHHGTHIMWHVLVALVLRLNIALPVAAALVTAACKTVELALVNRLYTMTLRVKRGWVTLLSVVSTLVTGVVIPNWGIAPINGWHSSTQLIAMVWMILCTSYVANCYDEFEQLLPAMGEKAVLPWKKPIAMGVMLLASLAAKPTFMQVFLPAACLYFGVKWIKHPKNGRFFRQIIVCVLPSVLLMILQYMYYFGIIVPHQSSMILEFSWQKFRYAALDAALCSAFPIFVLVMYSKRKNAGTLYWLTLAFDVVGIAEYVFLGESGRRSGDGNFGWGMLGAALMMWFVSVIRFVRCMRDDWQQKPKLRPSHVAGIALMGWHLATGIYYIGLLLQNTGKLF